MPKRKRRIYKTLRYSFWDGIFAAIQSGVVDQFATPLALFLGANNFAIGFLGFVRNALVSIVQVFSADLTLWIKSRKKLITTCVFLTATLWFPSYFIPYFMPYHRVLTFIILFSLASSFNMLANPAWGSLMTEYIPYSKRGKYFGWRGTVLGWAYTVSVIVAGVILYYFRPVSLFWGFAILMLIAAVSRYISWFFVTLMYEPRWQSKEAAYFSLWDFIRQFRHSNFARFAIFSAFFILGVSLVSPFFAVYILKELHLNYFDYTLLMGATSFTMFVPQRFWGEQADRYGNMRIIRVTLLMVSLVPLLWMFSQDLIYLFIIQLLAGFGWAGLNLASTNFIYDVSAPNKRERCLSYYNFLIGIGIGLGAFLGGILYDRMPPLFGTAFFSLIILSCGVRLVFAGLIRYFTKEVRV
jgi:MFS family permease